MAALEFPVGVAVREIWPEEEMARAYLEDKVTLGLIPKNQKFTASKLHFFVKTSGSQGLGKTYADAKRNRSANGQREFEVEPVATYGSTAVGGRVFRRVKAGAHTDILIDELKEAIEGLRQTAKDEFGRFVFGDGTGVLATVDAATNVATANLILTKMMDMRNLDEGFPLDFVNPGTMTVRPRLTFGKVDSADPLNRLLVLDNVITAICAGAAAGDLIVREGMFMNAPWGFDAWNPLWETAADLTDPFCGVVRSSNPVKLAGNVYRPLQEGVTDPLEQLLGALTQNHIFKGNAKHIILGPQRWNKLRQRLEGQIRYCVQPAAKIGKFNPGIEYKGIEVIGGRGAVGVFMDPDCPEEVGRCLEIDQWVWDSTGPMFNWDIGEETVWRTEDSADEKEVRMIIDGNMRCKAPHTTTTIDFEAE